MTFGSPCAVCFPVRQPDTMAYRLTRLSGLQGTVCSLFRTLGLKGWRDVEEERHRGRLHKQPRNSFPSHLFLTLGTSCSRFVRLLSVTILFCAFVCRRLRRVQDCCVDDDTRLTEPDSPVSVRVRTCTALNTGSRTADRVRGTFVPSW